MRHCLIRLVLALAAVFSANATTIAFRLDIWTSGTAPGAFDTAFMKLTNKTTGGNARISKFEVLLGDTSYNFDLSTNQTSTGGLGTIARASSGGFTMDAVSGGVRSNSFAWTFTTFDANDTFTTWTELDLDAAVGGNSVTDFRTVLFGPGGAPNATIKVTFVPVAGSIPSTTTMSYTLPGKTANSNTAFVYSFLSVPEPDTLAMMGMGIVAIGFSRLRRA